MVRVQKRRIFIADKRKQDRGILRRRVVNNPLGTLVRKLPANIIPVGPITKNRSYTVQGITTYPKLSWNELKQSKILEKKVLSKLNIRRDHSEKTDSANFYRSEKGDYYIVVDPPSKGVSQIIRVTEPKLLETLEDLHKEYGEYHRRNEYQ